MVDEAQDISDRWWEALAASVVDPEDGILWAFTDRHQRIFDREGEAPITLSPFVLGENLRNPGHVAREFVPLAAFPQRLRLPDGVPVRLVDAAPFDVVSRADDAVLTLGDEGWKSGQMALLTTGNRHPVQAELVETYSWDAYWDEFFAGEELFYGHVRVQGTRALGCGTPPATVPAICRALQRRSMWGCPARRRCS